jgi:hypothetical protein
VGPRTVVVLEIRSQHTPQMLLSQYDNVVEALSAY